MKICGIIAEFNPFHNGHKYIIEEARRITNADYIVIAMSGDYLQRGEPAFIDKYARCKVALQNGADLVIEIPSLLATGSAQYFARGGIGIFHALGCINTYACGSETGTPFTTNLDVIQKPNDILASEYSKACDYFSSKMESVFIKRIGTDYHDEYNISHINDLDICSATYIRQNILQNYIDLESLNKLMPKSMFQTLNEYQNSHRFLSFDDLSDLLFYKLTSEQNSGYDMYFDVYTDLSDKICNYINCYTTASEFRTLLKSKDIAFTHISRALLHILLNQTKEDLQLLQDMNYCPYIRPLGFQRKSAELFSVIKDTSKVPILSKLADANKVLTDNQMHLLTNDINASHLYRHLSIKNGAPLTSEYQQKMIII